MSARMLMIPSSSAYRMGSRAVVLLSRTLTASSTSNHRQFSLLNNGRFYEQRNYSVRSAVEPPDLVRLAETARISLTPTEVEEFAPKIQQVLDWFGQLQAVDLQSVEPSIRADTEGDSLRDDSPQIFENREAIITAIPNFEEPYIKVPKVLNKE